MSRLRHHPYRALLRYPRSVWPWLAAAVGLGLLASVVAALQPLPLKLLVDNALGSEPAPPWVVRAMGAVGLEPTPTALVLVSAAAALVLAGAAVALGSGLSLLWEYVGRRMIRDLTVDLFDQVQRRSLTERGRTEMGDTLSRLSTDTWSVYSMTHALMSAPFERLLTMGAVSFAAWHLSPSLALVTLAVGVPFAALTHWTAMRLRPATRRDREARAGVLSVMNQVLAAMPVVQGFAAEERARAWVRRRMDGAVETGRRSALTGVAAQSAAGLLGSASTAAVLIVGGVLVLDGGASLGTLLAFLVYLKLLDRETRRLLTTYRALIEGSVGLDRVLELWGGEPEIADPPDPVELPPVRAAGARVELERVTVGYEAGRPVLRDLDLVIEPGEVVALTGSSGAGKTTLACLLPRFLDPWEGAVRLDGVDLRRARVHDVRRRVAVVAQDSVLLPASVADNIAYGRPEAGLAQIRAAAAAANADGFIAALPEGYDTVLGEGGATLSGGQRQRIALARAFLKDAPLLVLDEPTSALDGESEALIVDAIRRIARRRTVLVIAHRPSTIRHADRVLVLGEGAVATGDRADAVDGAPPGPRPLEPVASGIGAGR